MSFNNEAERLADALTEYGEAFDDGPGMFAEAAALLRSQAAKLARREVDAERYRWLRSRPLTDEDDIYIAVEGEAALTLSRWALGGDDPNGCDTAIDAARAAAPTEGAQS